MAAVVGAGGQVDKYVGVAQRCGGDRAGGGVYGFGGPRPVPDGYQPGYFGTEPGHPTDDSTLRLLLAEHLAEVVASHDGQAPDPDDVSRDGYTRRLVAWVDGNPDAVGVWPSGCSAGLLTCPGERSDLDAVLVEAAGEEWKRHV